MNLRWLTGLGVTLLSGASWAADIAYLAFTDDYWQIWAMNADGSSQRQVTRTPYDKNHLSWYPDGQHVLVCGNQGELVRVAIASGKETTIKLPIAGSGDASLSPDGKTIAFSVSTSVARDDNNVWLVDANGTNLRLVVQQQWLQHEPRWSPDGSSVYYLSGNGQQSHDIWQYQLQNRSLNQITSNSLYHFDVSVAASGRLAYSSNRDGGDYDIFVRELDGRERALIRSPGLDANPSWSVDEKQLAFESTRAGRSQIWLLSLNNYQLTQLTRHAKGARKPVWRWK